MAIVANRMGWIFARRVVTVHAIHPYVLNGILLLVGGLLAILTSLATGAFAALSFSPVQVLYH